MNYLHIIIIILVVIIIYLIKNWVCCLIKIIKIQKLLDELEKELKDQEVNK